MDTFCIGMPVRFDSGPVWHVTGLHEVESGENKGEFSGLIVIERPFKVVGCDADGPILEPGHDRLAVPPESIRPVDGLAWFEDVIGDEPILHIGLDDLG